jgi:hypothetical protein
MKIGFLGLLTLIFVTLKLCSVISWSWVWVLSPLWMPLVIVFCVVFFLTVVMGLADKFTK